MAIWYIFLLIIAVVVFVLVIYSILVSRNTKLKCPNCGAIFNAPIFDQKNIGVGFTFPYTGVLACPKCGEKRHRRDYEKIK